MSPEVNHPPGVRVIWRTAADEALSIHVMEQTHLYSTINFLLRRTARSVLPGADVNEHVFEDRRTKAGQHFPFPPLDEVLKQYPDLLYMLDELHLRQHPGYAQRQERYVQCHGGSHVKSFTEAELERYNRRYKGSVPRYCPGQGD